MQSRCRAGEVVCDDNRMVTLLVATPMGSGELVGQITWDRRLQGHQRRHVNVLRKPLVQVGDHGGVLTVA